MKEVPVARPVMRETVWRSWAGPVWRKIVTGYGGGGLAFVKYSLIGFRSRR